MLVLSSPSGAGKTTLARRLLAADDGIEMSVSVTTRKIRPGERDGVDYHFIDDAAFLALIESRALLEWAEVFGRRYGTPKAPVEAALAAGRDVLFDIDWQGARQVRGRAGGDVVSVFVLPPTASALEQRLRARGQDAPEAIARRLADAAAEISHWEEYDYVIVNRDVDRSFAELTAILTAERLRRSRHRERLAGLVAELERDL
jgi:guanylate kinase